jgi:hypothetical protein
LNVGRPRGTPFVASVVVGIGVGVALHGLSRRPTPTAYSFEPAFTGCQPDATNTCHCDRDRLPAGEQRDPAVRARALLTNYSTSLCQLASAVDDFRKSPVADQAQLQRAAAPLIAPIIRVNDTARELQWARLPLTIDMLSRSGNESPAGAKLACGLKSANRYQVETFRNNLNALTVNIVAAWQGNADASTYDNIRRQQASDWPKLALLLRRGCEQYRQDGPGGSRQ